MSALDDLGTNILIEFGEDHNPWREFKEFETQLRAALDHETELVGKAIHRFEHPTPDKTRAAVAATFRPEDRDEAFKLLRQLTQLRSTDHERDESAILLNRLWEAQERFEELKPEDTDEQIAATVRTLLSIREGFSTLRRAFWETVEGTTSEATAPIERRLQELRDRALAPEA